MALTVTPDLEKFRGLEVSEHEDKEKQDFCRAIVLNHEGKVLLLKRNKQSKFGAKQYELPGGKVDLGEEFDAALLRELFEETGLKGQIPEQTPMDSERIMEKVGTKHDNMTAFTHSKVVLVDDYNIDTGKLKTEHMDYKWCTKEEVEQLFDKEELSKTSLDVIFKSLLQM